MYNCTKTFIVLYVGIFSVLSVSVHFRRGNDTKAIFLLVTEKLTDQAVDKKKDK